MGQANQGLKSQIRPIWVNQVEESLSRFQSIRSSDVEEPLKLTQSGAITSRFDKSLQGSVDHEKEYFKCMNMLGQIFSSNWCVRKEPSFTCKMQLTIMKLIGIIMLFPNKS